jgi:hypothetical protein
MGTHDEVIVDDPMLDCMKARVLPIKRLAIGDITPVPVFGEDRKLKRFNLSVEFCPAPSRREPRTWPAVLPRWQIDQLQAENPDVDISRWFIPMPEPPSLSRTPGWTPPTEPVERRIEKRIAERMGLVPPHLS